MLTDDVLLLARAIVQRQRRIVGLVKQVQDINIEVEAITITLADQCGPEPAPAQISAPAQITAVCRTEGCAGDAVARGLCRRHLRAGGGHGCGRGRSGQVTATSRLWQNPTKI